MKRKRYRKIKSIPKFKMTRQEYRNEYLKSPEWKTLRSDFLSEKNGLCERCGNIGKDVHHTKYDFNLSNEEQNKRMMLLCRQCHNLVHKAVKHKLLQFPHFAEDVVKIDEKKINTKVKETNKKHLVSMMLISDIVLHGSSHGILLACAKLKVPHKTFCSIPPNLKATQEQIEYLRWIAKTKPTRDGWKTKHHAPKKSKKEKERLRKLKVELGLRQPKIDPELCPF